MNKQYKHDTQSGTRKSLPCRKSIRLQGYDYSQPGLYFITICCEKRIHRFGRIENNEMVLNEFGNIAYNEWIKTLEIRTNVELGEFIIMPNHFHAIIRITCRGELHSPANSNEMHSSDNTNELHSSLKTGECQIIDKMGECQTIHKTGECNSQIKTGEFNSPLRGPSQTVGAIVRGYKSSVSKQLGLLGFDGKLWQRNYYEHIIRDEQSYKNISEYIRNNPAKWVDDTFKNK